MINLTNKTAKFSTTKITSVSTALFLILIMAGSLMFLPPANATVSNYHQYIYVGASPNVVGVNQQTLLVLWTNNIPPDIGEQENLIPGLLRDGWDSESFNVTTPSGVTTNYPLGRSDPVGGGYLSYTPTEVGTYTVISIIPAIWKNATTGMTPQNQAYYSAAVSAPITFTVQQTPVASWPETPLPTTYWTRPVNTANRYWYPIEGNWLGGAYQQPPGAAGGTTTLLSTGSGPESAHILWTTPYYIGGLMDEMFGNYGYETAHYQGITFGAPIIDQGKIICAVQGTHATTMGWQEIDLYTGAQLYFNNNTAGNNAMPSFGQIYNYESPNQHGGLSYLWRTTGVQLPAGYTTASGLSTWEMLDAYTLNEVCVVANVSSGGTAVYGPDGSLLRYSLVNYGTTAAPNYHLLCWNSSAMIAMLAGPTGTLYWQWRPEGGGFGGGPPLGQYVYNGATAFDLNASIPSVLGPLNSITNQTGAIQAVRVGQYVIIGTAGQNDERGVVPGFMEALSLAPGSVGSVLWKNTFTPPLGSQADNITISLTGVYPDDGVMCFSNAATLERWGYNLTSGVQLWESPPENNFQYYGMTTNYYDGLLLSYGYGGQLYAYNITTGKYAWIYNATSVGFESPYGGYYPIGIMAISGDGLIYTVGSEHSPTQPLWRGPNLRCINATDGSLVWDILFWGASMSPTSPNGDMADGIVVALNYFDMELYAFGRGPSATTVSAPQSGAVAGSPLEITGTVTDQTATGRRNTNGDFDFTLKGTPAISDADQSAWMEYMFMQQAMPSNATGVPVSLDAIDPNGNYIHIGDVTSNIAGTYGCQFTPQVPGQYQITATFAGSNSYGGSFSETYLTAGSVPAATAAPTATPTSVADVYFVPAIVGLFVLIIVVLVVVVLLMLRKRP